jgi:predicted MFS family arabinose efflux permease
MALPMFFAGSLCLINVIAAAFRLPESLTPELRQEAAKNRQPRLPALMKALGRPQFGALILIYFLATTGFAMMESIFALLMQRQMGMNATNIGLMFGFIGIVAVPIQAGLMGRLSRVFGEWRLLPTGLGMLALGFVAVTGVTKWTGVLIAAATISIGNALAQPSTMALISRTAAAHEQGGTMGVSQSAGAMARILGPSVAGTLFGLYFAFPLYCAAALMMSALVIAVTTAARLPQAEEGKTAG